MKKLLNRIKNSPIVKNGGENFLHFFLAFTIIFVALTIIIIQIQQSGLYKVTDQNLRNLSQNPVFISKFDGNQSENLGPMEDLLFYDSNGNLISFSIGISKTVVLAELEKVAKFNKNEVDKINPISIKNPYDGSTWHFRYLTIPVVNDDKAVVGYIQIFSNVDQLQSSLSRSILIIITTMVVFWILSIFISLFLANWSLKPVMEAYERQKQFVENASHELRTPLAILQNRLELLFQKPTSTIIDESENISESLSEVRNMRLLTSNLLNMARRENEIKIQAELTGKEYFENIFTNYEMLAENSGKTFKKRINLEGKVNLDHSLIKQLLTILFDNANKYTNEGGEISVDVYKSGNFMIFIVEDNGDGISDEDKKKIFDRFYRVDKARTRQKGGLGLGLSLAKQIVDAHNGKITVEDNQPKGTRFIVRLRLESTPKVNPAKIFQKL